MAGSRVSVKQESGAGAESMAMSAIVNQWEVQYGRFILVPPPPAVVPHPLPVPQTAAQRKMKRSGAWISTSAAIARAASLKIIAGSSSDYALNLSVHGTVLDTTGAHNGDEDAKSCPESEKVTAIQEVECYPGIVSKVMKHLEDDSFQVTAIQEVEEKSEVMKYLEDDSFQDLMVKVEKIISHFWLRAPCVSGFSAGGTTAVVVKFKDANQDTFGTYRIKEAYVDDIFCKPVRKELEKADNNRPVVLIVDVDAGARFRAQLLLHLVGFDTRLVRDGVAAASLLGLNVDGDRVVVPPPPIAAVLTEVNLTDELTGLDLVKNIKDCRNEWIIRSKTFMISTGASAFFPKPFYRWHAEEMRRICRE